MKISHWRNISIKTKSRYIHTNRYQNRLVNAYCQTAKCYQ